MKKMTIEMTEEVFDAVTEEGLREFRTTSQQASYLLLLWAREMQEKRHKAGKGVSQVSGSSVVDTRHER